MRSSISSGTSWPTVAVSSSQYLRSRCSPLITGVNKIALRRILDERGTIFHMLRADDPHFLGFGEIYFSTVYRDVVKGWHRHRLMTLNYAVPFGWIKLVLFDDRVDSATRGTIEELPRAGRLLAGSSSPGSVERV